MPKLSLALVWHERTQQDPGSTLFRRAIVDAVGLSTRARRHGGGRRDSTTRSGSVERGANSSAADTG
jgi:hypothetical protein